MISAKLKDSVMRDIVLLSLIGVKVVLVHGGGPEITETLEKLGKQTQFVDGLRVTDAETADVVLDMPDDVSNINISQYNTLFVNPTSDDYRVSDDIKEFAGKANLDGKTIVVIYDVAQDIINGVSSADELMENTVWLTGGKLSDNAGDEEIKNWVNGLGMELIADDEE